MTDRQAERDSHSGTDREMDQEAWHNAYQIAVTYPEGPGARATIGDIHYVKSNLRVITLVLSKSYNCGKI